jgi:hypothetical protein
MPCSANRPRTAAGTLLPALLLLLRAAAAGGALPLAPPPASPSPGSGAATAVNWAAAALGATATANSAGYWVRLGARARAALQALCARRCTGSAPATKRTHTHADAD